MKSWHPQYATESGMSAHSCAGHDFNRFRSLHLRESQMVRRIPVTPGDRYGQMTVVEEVKPHVSVGGAIRRRFSCKCDCGTTTTVWMAHLRNGGTRSCGCVRGTHRQSRTPTYKAWTAIKQRCTNPNESSYANYGDRGITVCDRWESFECFLEDMGERPSPQHSIDRIDNEQGYCKENCRWATRTQQNRNTRFNHLVTYNGETKCLAEWAEQLRIKSATLWSRLRLLGWSIEDAMTTPVDEGTNRHGATQ